MKRDYFLSIENPCEKILWKSMENSENGKFCNLCSKNVIDFSILSDSEIIRDICAKMSASQSNRLVINPFERKRFHLSKTITALLLVGSANSTLSSELNTTKTNQIVVLDSFNSLNKITQKNLIVETYTVMKTISGIIINENTDESLEHEYVSIEGTNIGVETDTLGNFKLNIPDDFMADEMVLVLKATGWQSDTRVTVYRKDLPITNLIIKKESPMVDNTSYKLKGNGGSLQKEILLKSL